MRYGRDLDQWRFAPDAGRGGYDREFGPRRAPRGYDATYGGAGGYGVDYMGGPVGGREYHGGPMRGFGGGPMGGHQGGYAADYMGGHRGGYAADYMEGHRGGYGADYLHRGAPGYGGDYLPRGGRDQGMRGRDRGMRGPSVYEAYQQIARRDAREWTRPWRSSMPGGTVLDMSVPYGMGRGRYL